MKIIYITKKKVPVLVDDEDYDRLRAVTSWCLVNGYAVWGYDKTRHTKVKPPIYMHRMIVDVPDGMDVDHMNRNRADNRRCNLRVATRSQNSWNNERPVGISGLRGVQRQKNRWLAKMKFQGKNMHIGSYLTPEEASAAFKAKAKELHGEFYRER